MQNIILLHGALGAAVDLEPLSAALKSRDLNPFTFSFSGHSKTAFNAAFGIEQFAEELHHFIRQNELINPHIFGYSMGGYVAMYLASYQKNLIGKIITLGTKFNWDKTTVEKETRQLNPDSLLSKVPAFAAMLETKHGAGWKDLVSKTAGMMERIGEKNFLNSSVVNVLETHVLLGIADRDQMVSLEETRLIFKQLPNAAMYMLPQSKHQLESVDLTLLCKLISDFVLRK